MSKLDTSDRSNSLKANLSKRKAQQKSRGLNIKPIKNKEHENIAKDSSKK